MHPVDYFQHDDAYQRRRATGQPGWETATGLQENLDLLEKIFSAPHFPKTGRLLELGCGAGDMSLWAAQRGFEVHGLDISPTAIQWANEKMTQRNLQAHLQLGNVLDLSAFADDSFDIVLDGRCFHCIIGADRATFLQGARRVLKPGGVFHFGAMCGTPSCEEYLKEFDPLSRCIVRDGMAVRFLGLPNELETEVRGAGFVIINQRVMPRRNDRELDLLLLDATKP
jgi:cyclopropane fatty-acyl-phospholipid synthase-like methyltransferase